MIAASLLLFFMAAGAALAQAPKPLLVPGEPETVTSQADREKFDHTVHEFVKSLATPAPFAEKVTQWSRRNPLCPKAASPSPELNAFVTQRIREVARMVGAPLQAPEPCRTNMMVVFTNYPQALLDDVRKTAPRILGYVTISQRERAATVRYLIQAWYGTATRDWHGGGSLDDANRDTPPQLAIIGSHTRDGLRSELATVLVVVDTSRLISYRREAIADYVALLALTQTQSFDSCRGMASIANLLAEGCDTGTRTDALSENDIAYLKALYDLNPDKVLGRQVSSIASAMEDTLGKH